MTAGEDYTGIESLWFKGEDGSDIEVTIPEERNEDGSTTTQYVVEGKDGAAGEYEITVGENGAAAITEDGAQPGASGSVSVSESVVGD